MSDITELLREIRDKLPDPNRLLDQQRYQGGGSSPRHSASPSVSDVGGSGSDVDAGKALDKAEREAKKAERRAAEKRQKEYEAKGIWGRAASDLNDFFTNLLPSVSLAPEDPVLPVPETFDLNNGRNANLPEFPDRESVPLAEASGYDLAGPAGPATWAPDAYGVKPDVFGLPTDLFDIAEREQGSGYRDTFGLASESESGPNVFGIDGSIRGHESPDVFGLDGGIGVAASSESTGSQGTDAAYEKSPDDLDSGGGKVIVSKLDDVIAAFREFVRDKDRGGSGVQPNSGPGLWRDGVNNAKARG